MSSSLYAIRSPIFTTGLARGASYLRDTSELPKSDTDRIDFHVVTGDYFATLATIMALIADQLSSGYEGASARSAATLMELRRDLLYLQEKFRIERR